MYCVVEQMQKLLFMGVLFVEWCNTCLYCLFWLLAAVKEREKMIDEVWFTIFLGTFNLFFRISLSFLGFLHLHRFCLKVGKWLVGWHHVVLLRWITRVLSKSKLGVSKSWRDENFLLSIDILIGVLVAEVLVLLRDKIGG